jgi:hypothetical protein
MLEIKPWILSDEQFRTILRSFVTDRSRVHPICTCRAPRCLNRTIERDQPRAAWAIRTADGERIMRGYCHRDCLRVTS